MEQSPKPLIFSLYRKHLRQIKQLPHAHLQYFFRIKVADDVRTVLGARSDRMRHKKINRISKDLRRLERANGRSVKDFAHILDLAYGRKGKIRWEIMKPLLSDSNLPDPPPIISGEPKSRPPVYPPELTILLTSAISRSTKPLEKHSLVTPPHMPSRADASSEEARFLGPLSKRRQVNIRWRFFTKEWKKVLPPLDVRVGEKSSNGDCFEASDRESLVYAGIRGIGMQGAGVFEEIEKLIGSVPASKPLTRRQKRTIGDHPNASSPPATFLSTTLPRRWIIRRYRQLLGRLPIMTYFPKTAGNPRGAYAVSLSPVAMTPSQRLGGARHPEIGDDDLTWLKEAKEKG